MSEHNNGKGLHPHRCRLEAELVVDTALHVGTGEFEDGLLDDPVAGKGDKAGGPSVAIVARDAGGRPYLPGPSVKGLLRRLCGEEKQADALFGSVRGRDGGRMSPVFVWGAECLAAGEVGGAPYAAVLAGKGYMDTFVAARTAIDAKTGTADHNRLFFQEMVPPGARFHLRLLVVGDTAVAVDEVIDGLRLVLGRLVAGASIGRGQSDGQGRLRLLPGTLSAMRLSIDNDGSLAETPLAIDVKMETREATCWTLRLVCPGPFVVADSSHRSVEAETRDRLLPHDPARAQIKAQRLGDRRPLVLGSSIMGALRARATWIVRLRRHRGDADADEPMLARLFGEVGFRGLLGISRLEVSDATPWSATSVRIDRYSGAPIDNMLFTTAAFLGTVLTLTLVLEERGRPTEAERRLVEALVADIETNGLMLGHGTNKGYGWFIHVPAPGGGEA